MLDKLRQQQVSWVRPENSSEKVGLDPEKVTLSPPPVPLPRPHGHSFSGCSVKQKYGQMCKYARYPFAPSVPTFFSPTLLTFILFYFFFAAF